MQGCHVANVALSIMSLRRPTLAPMTLARYFASLRNDSGLSLRALASRSKEITSFSSLSKIERGVPIRAKTLGLALRTLGFSERDPQYIQAFALWSTEQAKTLPHAVVDQGINRVRTGQDRSMARILHRAETALRAMPETDRDAAVRALEHPEALKLWLASAAALSRK